MTTKEKCYYCHYFLLQKTILSDGLCRRHPPSHGDAMEMQDGRTIDYLGKWPKVKVDSWCGEFKAIKQ